MSRDYDRDSDDLDDDARDRDRPSRRRKSSSGSLLLILGGIGCVVLLGCGGLIAVGIYGAFDSPMVTQLPTGYIDGRAVLRTSETEPARCRL